MSIFITHFLNIYIIYFSSETPVLFRSYAPVEKETLINKVKEGRDNIAFQAIEGAVAEYVDESKSLTVNKELVSLLRT